MRLPGENLGHTAVGDPQLPGDVARSYAVVGKLHYSLPNDVRQRPPIHKNAAQLVHTAVA